MKKQMFFRKFGTVTLAVSAATIITLLVPPLGGGGMYFLFLTAIVFSSLYGDFRGGIAATVLSILICVIFVYYDQASGFSDWLVLPAFALAAVFTVLLCYAQVGAETARRKAERRYRAIFEDSITGIYETTLDGRYATANPKLAAMFGFDSAAQLINEAENLNRRFYVAPERREKFISLVEQKGNLVAFESEIYRRDGATIWISENALAVRDDAGKLVGFQGTTIEITDRKQAESELKKAHEELEQKVVERTAELERANQILRDEIAERNRIENALRESEEKFRNLVEATTDWIWETNAKGFYTYASPKIKDLIGFEPEEIVGKRPYDLMMPEEAERVRRVVLEMTAAGKGLTALESVQLHNNGRLVTTETSSVPFYDESGKLLGARGIARDITKRKRIENELRASQKQLRDLSAHLQSVREEERRNLARELHDEFGQSMTALKLELVRLDGKKAAAVARSDNKIPAMIEIVDTAMGTIRKIVSELRPGVLDELGLAAAMEWQTKEFQKRTGIVCDLNVEFEEPAACLKLKTTVFRILQECLTNIARHAAAQNVRITLLDEGTRIFFEVEDDGRGIDLARSEAGDSRSFGILGMRERALLLDGTVEISRVETDGGSGTRVTVSIPRPPEPVKFV